MVGMFRILAGILTIASSESKTRLWALLPYTALQPLTLLSLVAAVSPNNSRWMRWLGSRPTLVVHTARSRRHPTKRYFLVSRCGMRKRAKQWWDLPLLSFLERNPLR